MIEYCISCLHFPESLLPFLSFFDDLHELFRKHKILLNGPCVFWVELVAIASLKVHLDECLVFDQWWIVPQRFRWLYCGIVCLVVLFCALLLLPLRHSRPSSDPSLGLFFLDNLLVQRVEHALVLKVYQLL